MWSVLQLYLGRDQFYKQYNTQIKRCNHDWQVCSSLDYHIYIYRKWSGYFALLSTTTAKKLWHIKSWSQLSYKSHWVAFHKHYALLCVSSYNASAYCTFDLSLLADCPNRRVVLRIVENRYYGYSLGFTPVL